MNASRDEFVFLAFLVTRTTFMPPPNEQALDEDFHPSRFRQ